MHLAVAREQITCESLFALEITMDFAIYLGSIFDMIYWYRQCTVHVYHSQVKVSIKQTAIYMSFLFHNMLLLLFYFHNQSNRLNIKQGVHTDA